MRIHSQELIEKIFNALFLKIKKAQYSDDLKINGRIRLHGDGELVIGKNVRINSSERSNPVGGMTFSSFSVYAPGKIVIGDNTGISNSAIVCKKGVFIGDNVKIGGNVKIYDTDFHSLDFNDRMNNDKPVCREVYIGNNAFIGAHSIILKGCHIGSGAVIGAGSVVTKDIPDYEIWAGNPAHFIRKVVK